MSAGGFIVDNFFKNETNDFSSAAISVSNGEHCIENNIIVVDGSSIGIQCLTDLNTCRNNSIYASAGTGIGINAGTGIYLNNIIEGFSGAGGDGFVLASGKAVMYGNNKFYNNATNETFTGDVISNLGNNDTLGASPFTNPAGDDFSVSTAVKAGAYPSSFYGSNTNQYLDVGAAQRMEFAARARYLMGIG